MINLKILLVYISSGGEVADNESVFSLKLER